MLLHKEIHKTLLCNTIRYLEIIDTFIKTHQINIKNLPLGSQHSPQMAERHVRKRQSKTWRSHSNHNHRNNASYLQYWIGHQFEQFNTNHMH